jgi:hypothetical protein
VCMRMAHVCAPGATGMKCANEDYTALERHRFATAFT